MCKISIIIPVYNVEKYIKKCLNSIKHQTYKDFEVILVDDGSTDNSGKICDEYSKNDIRFKTYHIKNGGPSKARNYGLDRVTGDYVTFVDSDDWLDSYVIDKILNYVENNPDLILYNIRYHYKAVIKEVKLFENIENQNINVKKLRNYLLTPQKYTDKSTLALTGSVCKVYKREIISKARYINNLNYAEDLCFFCQVLKNIKTILYIRDVFYNYNVRTDSISHSWKEDYVKENLHVLNWLLDLYRDEVIFDVLNELCFENYCNVSSKLIVVKGLSSKKKKQILQLYLSNIKYNYDFSKIDWRCINKNRQIQRMLIYKKKFFSLYVFLKLVQLKRKLGY